jgi:hypothetical protein
MRILGLLAVTLALSACSKKHEEPTRTGPWLANPALPEAGPKSAVQRYTVQARCELPVELKAREATPKGTFRVCRGELDVDLADLEHTRGSIGIDVASLEMESEVDGGRSDDYTNQAHNWLDVGSSRPEAERDRLRWVTFTLSALENPSRDSARAGKQVPSETRSDAPNDAGGEAGTEDTPREEEEELREVTFTARGTLVLHDVRVELSLPVRALFRFAKKAADSVPDRITLSARRPVRVSLDAHEIKPRDERGLFLAEGMKLFGAKVGREARVGARIELVRADL